MSSTENRKTVTLVYQPHGRFATERTFEGLTDDDMAFVVAALAGRRFRSRYHDADMEQVKATREAQMEWYATRMVEALYDGLGRWRRLLPMRILKRMTQRQMDYLMDITATWTGELIGMHAEVTRSSRPPLARRVPAQRSVSAPENGPRERCAATPTTTCLQEALLGQSLPKGWTRDAAGRPHCPEHPVAKGEAA